VLCVLVIVDILGQNEEERSYIQNEARGLFRQNSQIQDSTAVSQKLMEAESRLEIGLHYGIPYPRLTNVIPGATGKSREAVLPAYMDSYESHGSKETPEQVKIRTPKAPSQ